MIHALRSQHFEALAKPTAPSPRSTADFGALFGSAAQGTAKAAPLPADNVGIPVRTLPGGSSPSPTQADPGDPDVQGWLNSFYAQRAAETSPAGTSGGMSETTSYEAAPGAGSNYTENTVYGPGQIYQQALANQCGNAFAAMTGLNAASLTSQLPGIPSAAAQQAFDNLEASQNAQRLASGQPIDTAAYWSDPGSISLNGTTYTSQQLGYCGAAQSSGPEPIYIAQNNQVGKDTFTVPGYEGTVKGIQANRYYTLAQLEQAGLKAGQPDAQFYPGSWSATKAS